MQVTETLTHNQLYPSINNQDFQQTETSKLGDKNLTDSLKDTTTLFDPTLSLKERIQPYFQFIELAQKTEKVSSLIKILTHDAGGQEPSSEKLAYLMDKGFQYFSEPLKKDLELTNLKIKAREDKEVFSYLLKTSDLSEENKVGVLRLIDNHIKMLSDMQSFNSLKLLSRSLLGCGAISTAVIAIKYLSTKTPISQALPVALFTLGLGFVYNALLNNHDNKIILNIKKQAPFLNTLVNSGILFNKLNNNL